MKKAPKRITAARLVRITAHYLERYTSTSANLRRLLVQRSDRAAAHHGEDPAEGRALVDAEIARLIRVGLLDDAAWARDKARALVRRGTSARRIEARLREKGVPAELVDAALAAARDESGDPELRAAAKVARVRRLGPWRTRPPTPEERWRDIQKLGRAGFSFDLARRVVDAANPEELETEGG